MNLSCSDRKKIALSILNKAESTAEGKIAATCPLHLERTPGGAFFYDPEKDSAYCFSCGQKTNLVGIINALKGRLFDAPEGYNELDELVKHKNDSVMSDDLTLFRCHCGGLAALVQQLDEDSKPVGSIAGICMSCGCAGAHAETEKQAAFNWNILAEAAFSRDKSVADLIREHAEKERAKREAA